MWKKISTLAPVIPAILVAGCMVSSLSGYTEPVFAAKQPEAVVSSEAEAAEEPKKQEAVAVKEAEKTTSETVSVPETAAAKGNFSVADGTYQGEGTGYAGKIQVAVDVKDKTITAIRIVKNEADTESFFNQAKAVIDRILKEQRFDVDAVSGATYSSKGIMNAVKNALTKEKDQSSPAAKSSTGSSSAPRQVTKVQDASSYRDGTYYGSGNGFAGSGSISVKVVVSGGKIASAEITNTSDTKEYINRASSVLSRIVSSQSTNVDAVSGATYSSVGLIEAVRNALSQAKPVSGGTTTPTPEPTKPPVVETPTPTPVPTAPPESKGKFPYPDGTYTGSGEGFEGMIRVAVVIEDETLKEIQILESEDDEPFFGRAKALLNTMIQTQSLEVDAVSGATFSSGGLIEAVNNAVEEAKKSSPVSEAESVPEMTRDASSVPAV